VEVKHGAPLHPGQLAAYRSDLRRQRRRAEDRRLVVLAPVGFDDPQLQHCDVLADWQSLGVLLARWIATNPADRSVGAWLVRQLIEYLREEELVVTRPVDARDLAAIERRKSSTEAFTYLLSAVSRELADEWRPREEVWYASGWPRPTSFSWPDGGELWTAGKALFGPATVFGWALDRFAVARDRRVFAAGIWLRDRPTRRDPFSQEAWVDQRLRDEFVFGDEDYGPMLARFLPPSELVGLAIDDQVKRVVAFVKRTRA